MPLHKSDNEPYAGTFAEPMPKYTVLSDAAELLQLVEHPLDTIAILVSSEVASGRFLSD